MNPVIAVTGASGFIGSAIVRAASENLRVLVRAPHHSMRFRDRVVVGRLESAEALDELVDGVDTLVHCANYIGPDPELARGVNDHGTAQLVTAAARAGVRRIVYISTSGVYGAAPRFAADEHTPLAPSSATSRTRLVAEQHVLEAGGVVVRPHLVIGQGDRKVLPVLARAIEMLGGRPHPSPRTSVIRVDSLAEQVWWLVQHAEVREAVHPDHGAPVELAELLGTIRDSIGMASPASTVPVTRARELLAHAGLRPHQVEMLTAESTFGSSLTGRVPPPAAALSDADVRWYRGLFGAR